VPQASTSLNEWHQQVNYLRQADDSIFYFWQIYDSKCSKSPKMKHEIKVNWRQSYASTYGELMG
jgi:hypothetical protein